MRGKSRRTSLICIGIVATFPFSVPAASVFAQALTSDQIVCKLDPKCTAGGKDRSFKPGGDRGITSIGGVTKPTETISFTVNFEFGSAVLEQDALIILDALGAALADKKIAAYSFEISGHTDAKGNDDYNMALSTKRAEAVVSYISEKFGVDRNRLKAKGYGKTQLLDPANPEAGVNRRVQVANVGASLPVGEQK
jgi:outer membrane protein OmpA-like peptidoglycan-associated protein